MTRYLVTGGAGLIGSHVVDALAARGDVVRVVDDLSTGSADHLVGHPDVELIEANLADRQMAEAAVAGVEYAIHLAAIPSVPRSVQEPRRAHRANVEATHELLLAARGGGVRRVVLASSSSVYGESETWPQHEALRPDPRSPYALHKLVGEQYAVLFISTGLRRSRCVSSTSSDPGRRRTHRTPASLRCWWLRCSPVGRPRSTGTESRRATLRT